MAGQRQKPDFIVDPSGRAQDVRQTTYAPSQAPPTGSAADGADGSSKPPSPKGPRVPTKVIWIPIGLILSVLAWLLRFLILSQSDGRTFTSESAYNSFQSGSYDYFRGEYDEAIRHYSAAIDTESDVGDVYNARGLAYLAQGKHDQALADFDRARELIPDSAMVCNNRALVHLATGDYDLAIADLDRALELQATNGKAYYNRGLAYLSLGDYDQAVADFTQAAEYSDDWSSILRSLPTDRQAEARLAMPDETENRLRAMGSRVDLPLVYYQRGLAYLATGDHDRAIADFQQAVELQPDLSEASLALSLALMVEDQVPTMPAVPTLSATGGDWSTATAAALPTETPVPTATPHAAALSAWASTGLVGGDVLALAINPASPSTLYAGLSDGLVFRSTDGGEIWSRASAGLTGARVQALAIHPGTPATLYAGTARGLFVSKDGAATWTKAGSLTTNLNSLAIDPLAPSTLYVGSDGDGVYRSTDGGETWSTINTGLNPPLVISLAVDPMTPTTLYAGTHDYVHPVSMRYYPGNVYRSTDGGKSWRSLMFGYTHYLALAIDPGTPTTVYAGMTTNLYKSTDGGDNWSLASDGLAGRSVHALATNPLRPATLYAATSDGIYMSDDGGGHWISANRGLTNTDVRALAIDPATGSTIYAGTSGSGVLVMRRENLP